MGLRTNGGFRVLFKIRNVFGNPLKVENVKVCLSIQCSGQLRPHLGIIGTILSRSPQCTDGRVVVALIEGNLRVGQALLGVITAAGVPGPEGVAARQEDPEEHNGA
jgi:hypothetical protein